MAACLACIAPPPASRLPRKVYNALVADLFPAHAPTLDAPLSLFVRRRIAKLADYVAANPNQLPKVSRCAARSPPPVGRGGRQRGVRSGRVAAQRLRNRRRAAAAAARTHNTRGTLRLQRLRAHAVYMSSPMRAAHTR